MTERKAIIQHISTENHPYSSEYAGLGVRIAEIKYNPVLKAVSVYIGTHTGAIKLINK